MVLLGVPAPLDGEYLLRMGDEVSHLVLKVKYFRGELEAGALAPLSRYPWQRSGHHTQLGTGSLSATSRGSVLSPPPTCSQVWTPGHGVSDSPPLVLLSPPVTLPHHPRLLLALMGWDPQELQVLQPEL